MTNTWPFVNCDVIFVKLIDFMIYRIYYFLSEIEALLIVV